MASDLDNYANHPALAPIRPWLLDPLVTEIMINGPGLVYVERHGRMEQVVAPGASGSRLGNDDQLRMMIEVLLRPSGRSVDASSPYADGRLPDGSRVNVIIPPVALNGAVITIRKFTRALQELADLVHAGTLTQKMGMLLAAAVRARLNIVFSGATGTGKTTTLGILTRYIGEQERLVVIEDTAELEFKQAHVVRLQARGANIQGAGEITIAQLLRNALRMRPTRIIVGELRGPEAVDMLQAIASGHEGCLTVVHASSPADALARLEMMVLSRGLELPLWAIHRQIAASINLIVQHELLLDGQRKITRITEVTGMDPRNNDRVATHNLFEFEDRGPDAAGRVQGQFLCTGQEPTFLSRLERYRIDLPAGLFAAGPA